MTTKKSSINKHPLPQHGFKERYLIWQIGDISETWALRWGTFRFIILVFLVVIGIIAACVTPYYWGYFW